jgi:hypothetical protein
MLKVHGNTRIFLLLGKWMTLKKTWETRQTLRTRWGKKLADKVIFQAACKAEERYNEYLTGRRIATSRSPSVGLVHNTTREQRDKSIRSQSKLEVFRKRYLELAGVADFEELSAASKADLTREWMRENGE